MKRDIRAGWAPPRPGFGGAFFVAALSLLLGACSFGGAHFSVSGTVVGKGSPGTGVEGVTLGLEGAGAAKVTTDASGVFVIDGISAGTYRLVASKAGKVFSISSVSADGTRDSPVLNLYSGSLAGLVVTAVDADKVTISMIQGSGPRSPLEGQRVENVRGVVTKVTRQHQNGTYTVTQTDGSMTPQWVDTDGFYMEAIDLDIDGDPATSDGIFVCTHNPAFDDPKLVDTVPTDLAVGQVVTVSGTVAEILPVDRFGNSEGYLTVTRIVDPTVLRIENAGVPVTQASPDGVLLTYQDSPPGYTDPEKWRTLPWEDDTIFALGKSMKVFESVEGMTVRVDNPVTTGSDYYNVTPILADSGKKGGLANHDSNSYGSVVLKANDFNAEIIYCDYSPPTWKTFVPLPQTGDALKDTGGNPVLRGVMDYSIDGLYWISPLASQGYGFTPVAGRNDKTRTSSVDTYKPWRIGKTADPQFKASWPIVPKDNVADQNLTIGSYNIENYCYEEDSFGKYLDIADIILYNLRAPDLMTIVEMGDDHTSTVIYANQDNSYAVPDGYVWAVKNFRVLIDALRTKSAADVLNFGGGIEYDFREISPEENADGGAPGVNIRVGFLFRRDRLQFIDRGIRTNAYDTTSGAASTWPVPGDPAGNPKLLALARNNTTVAGYTGQDGVVRPRLTQSPGRLNASPFRGSRRPLVGEFVFLPTGKTFFAIAAHLSSKGGDNPLYGAQQPPTFSSETNRTQQAKAIYEMVKTIIGFNSTAKIVVMGDMNDFQFTVSLKTLSGAVYGSTGQLLFSPSEELLPVTERYSYQYHGNSQQIDHIYISSSLFGHTDSSASGANAVFIPHMNSLFAQNNHIETSDHDPITVHLAMGGY